MRWKVVYLLVLALALGLIVYTLIGPGGRSKQTQMQAELERILEENRVLAEDNRRLAREVEALKHRTDYLEKAARDELGLVKEDEVVFHLPETSAAGGDAGRSRTKSTDGGEHSAEDNP